MDGVDHQQGRFSDYHRLQPPQDNVLFTNSFSRAKQQTQVLDPRLRVRVNNPLCTITLTIAFDGGGFRESYIAAAPLVESSFSQSLSNMQAFRENRQFHYIHHSYTCFHCGIILTRQNKQYSLLIGCSLWDPRPSESSINNQVNADRANRLAKKKYTLFFQ